MNAYASSDGRFSRCVEEFVENAGAEIRQAAEYVDRVIVPEVRRETGAAARILAGHLERLADRLHPVNGPMNGQGNWPGNGPSNAPGGKPGL